MKCRTVHRLVLCAATIMVAAQAHDVRAQSSAPVQTLCVLDFQRVGDDARSEWLEQGLADLMIGALGSASPYLVVERRHLREILKEHGLAGSGVVDVATAVRRAQLVKAQLLLQGSFARQGDQLTVQVRLIRVSDQKVLSLAMWTDRDSAVLSAPPALSATLLRSLEAPASSARLDGIESLIPTTIDAAKAYYQGVRAFDNGQYPEALAHYLDAARVAADFRSANAGVLDLYYLLGRSEHAVLFARDLARSAEAAGNVSNALEYYFAAARESLGPVNDQRLGRDLLNKLLSLVEQHETATAEMAATRRAILDRIDLLQRTGQHRDPAQILADRDIRYQVWPGDIESELTRRAEEQARGGSSVLENGTWVKRPVPRPTVLMWKIRALSTLARASAQSGDIRASLDQYRALLGEYDFLTSRNLEAGRLTSSIKTEAHFMMLHHHSRTGRLIRDHAMNRINSLNVVTNGLVFTRDFRDPDPDARARVASRYDGRGYEYFDFAAPAGYQIDSVTLRAAVEGIAEFAVDSPQPAGWPPQYSLSKRVARFKLTSRGEHQRTATPSPGTEFLSVGTSWGPGLFSNTLAEVQHWKLNPPRDGKDVVRWEVTFRVSPRTVPTTTAKKPSSTPLAPVVQSVIGRYSAGWERASVVRDAESVAYAGDPRMDVYAEDWLVYSLNGDIQIFHQPNQQLKIAIPVTINSSDREFDASLVRTHEGRYALLFARGSSRTTASRFVAFSADLLRWDAPMRLAFEQPAASTGYTYAQAEPLERTYNVVAVREGYAMLLAQGFVRLSKDLRHWDPPVKAIAQDLLRNRLIRGSDGTVWAVYENSSRELQPYTPADWLHGYFVVDGKPYRHVTELRVSRSADGIRWEPAGVVTLAGQPSALWAFPVDDQRIGVALGFNNLSMKWLMASRFEGLAPVDTQLPFMHQSDEAEWFVRDRMVTCVRPVMDPEKQKPMLLSTSTARILGGSGKR